jgi:hypothetical protein
LGYNLKQFLKILCCAFFARVKLRGVIYRALYQCHQIMKANPGLLGKLVNPVAESLVSFINIQPEHVLILHLSLKFNIILHLKVFLQIWFKNESCA